MRLPAAVLLLVLLSLGVAGAASATRAVIYAGPKQNGQTVQLAPYETLVVSLPAARGYKWSLVATDEAVLQLVAKKSPSRSEKTPAKKRPGAGTKYVFTFQAGGSGETSLRLDYVRTSGKGKVQTYALTVVVG